MTIDSFHNLPLCCVKIGGEITPLLPLPDHFGFVIRTGIAYTLPVIVKNVLSADPPLPALDTILIDVGDVNVTLAESQQLL